MQTPVRAETRQAPYLSRLHTFVPVDVDRVVVLVCDYTGKEVVG